jgi:hypothetical protein
MFFMIKENNIKFWKGILMSTFLQCCVDKGVLNWLITNILGLHDPEDGGTVIVWIFGSYLPIYMA